MNITIRQARVFLTIHETGSVTAAAKKLNRAQTSVTKALQNLEQSIGVVLFERSTRGVKLTPFGDVLLAGARQAFHTFRDSSNLFPPIKLKRSASTARFFNMDVSEKWLEAFLAVISHGNISVAASALDLSPTAVSSSLRKIEDCLDTALFERTANGLEPTLIADALSSHIRLAQNLLRHSLDEISSMRGNHTGQVMVGTLPLSRTQILPDAIIALLEKHPDVDVATTESPYPDLVAGLRSGDVDFLLGALRGSRDEDIEEKPLFEDPLSIIVRTHHPLIRKKNVTWSDMLRYPWILPRHGTPTRALFEHSLKVEGKQAPEHVIETSSFITLRRLLMNSDRITVLSARQIAYEQEYGMLTTLPIELRDTQRAIGITRRKKGTITPAANLLIKEIENLIIED